MSIDKPIATDASRNQLQQWDRQHYWHAFTQMAEYEPFLIQRAEGVYLYDIDDRAYLDGVSSMWCNVHGHNHPHINAAITEQLNKVAHVTSLGMSNPTTVRLTRRLAESTAKLYSLDQSSPNQNSRDQNAGVDGPLEKVFFSSDGACAIEVALKLAFQYWRQCPQPQPQRNLFLAVGNAYHGDTLGGVSVGGVSRFHAMFDPLLFDVVRGPCPDTYRLPEGCAPDNSAEFYLNAYRELFDRFGERIAALIVEPLVQGAAGMVMHPPGFLKGLRQLTRQYDVLMIADEVAVGMGRTGSLWACEQEQVQPDFLCTGKGLTSGYLPMAATLTTSRIWQAFLGSYAESRSFFHGHTFGGNPLAAAAAMATLELFDSEQTLQRVQQRASELAELLQPLTALPHVGQVRQRGLIAAVELVRDKQTAEPYPWSERWGHRVCNAALERGVWLRPLGNVIVIMPPLCISSSELEQLADAVKYGISKVV